MHSSLLEQAQHRLLEWYKKKGRHHLPWRNVTDPYPIYLSEIMLQQTQVKTVMEHYYPRFLHHFPTLEAVAEGGLHKVLEVWQGLGYYRRAKYLYQTATMTQGILPDSLEGLMSLPGIGRNTGHAIMALAYRQPYAVMEANVRRIIHRLYALSAASETVLFEHATSLLGKNDPFCHNQAMMDLGAMVCTPKAPLCNECPLAMICQGKTIPEAYPAPRVKKSVPTRKLILALYIDGQGRVALMQREAEFLHGLYGLPELRTVPELCQEQGRFLGMVQHTYSHFKLMAQIWCISVASKDYPQYHWAELGDLPPISVADAKAISLYRAVLR